MKKQKKKNVNKKTIQEKQVIFKHIGPGNKWKVIISKSKLTGYKTSLSGVKYATACQFAKSHKMKL